MKYIAPSTIKRRKFWVEEIAKLSGNFGSDATNLENELNLERKNDGSIAILDHIRTCGALPEKYAHDSSEEKLYSKYTDILLANTFSEIGLKSLVMKERADCADVEVVAPKFSFVADAKAFRLSRTAKNQKDFKVDAMNSWKRAHKFAVVVCPVYQLPTRSSQIYLQATTRDVLILSYSHLAVLLRASVAIGCDRIVELLSNIFDVVTTIPQTKDSIAYWTAINRQFLVFDKSLEAIYKEERIALVESINTAKEEGLFFLSEERKRIMRLSHQEAIAQLIDSYNIINKISVINSVADNALLNVS